MFKLVFLPAIIIIVLTVYFTMRGAIKPSRNILFGVTLPNELLELQDIKNIVNEFKKKMNLYCLLGVILIIPVFFIKKMSIELIYLLVWCFLMTGVVINLPYKESNRKLKEFKKEYYMEKDLSKTDENNIYCDDEYWIDGYKYYNENDKSVLVSKRYGIGSTYNLATKKGRFLNYGSFIIIGGILIPFLVSMLMLDFSKPSIEVSKSLGTVSVNYPFYNYNFDIDDIEEIKLIEDANLRLKTNGIGTEEYSRGNYRSYEYGKCKVYIYNNSGPYILIKIKDKYLIYNEDNQKDTLKVYNQLKNICN